MLGSLAISGILTFAALSQPSGQSEASRIASTMSRVTIDSNAFIIIKGDILSK